MPSLNLIEPISLEESIRRAQTLDDQYGFRQRFRESSVEELIATFNIGVGVCAWVSARAAQLVALRDALLATGLDCSSFISATGMAMDRKVKREGNAIVAIQ
jgi:hypothetical protein